jgi:hypothetical protein
MNEMNSAENWVRVAEAMARNIAAWEAIRDAGVSEKGARRVGWLIGEARSVIAWAESEARNAS